MARYLFDIVYSCTLNTQKILMNFKLVNSVDKQIPREDQINGLSNLACIAVLNRKHGNVALTSDNRIVSRLEIAI